MPRAVKYLSIFLVVLAGLFLAGYLYLYLSIFIVTNITGNDISNVRVQVVKDVWWQGKLAQHETKWLFGMVSGNGSMTISFDVAGQRIARSCGYYFELGRDFERISLTRDAFYFEIPANGRLGAIIRSGQPAMQYPCEDKLIVD
jgi:hypothetical protein